MQVQQEGNILLLQNEKLPKIKNNFALDQKKPLRLVLYVALLVAKICTASFCQFLHTTASVSHILKRQILDPHKLWSGPSPLINSSNFDKTNQQDRDVVMAKPQNIEDKDRVLTQSSL